MSSLITINSILRTTTNQNPSRKIQILQKMADLNREGVAQQVGKASDRSEHGALDQPQRLLEHFTVFTQILLGSPQNPILSLVLAVIERNPNPNLRSRRCEGN